MKPLEQIIIPVLAGLLLGTIYFGGLWLTLRHLLQSRRPALLTLGSYLGRLAVCLTGFILVARLGDWPGVLVCLASFIAVRLVLVRLWGKPALEPS